VVQVSLAKRGADVHQFKYYDVAIAEADGAIVATRKGFGTTHEAGTKIAEIKSVRPLTAQELATLGLKSGDVRPA
jgi:hypothetical protein